MLFSYGMLKMKGMLYRLSCVFLNQGVGTTAGVFSMPWSISARYIVTAWGFFLPLYIWYDHSKHAEKHQLPYKNGSGTTFVVSKFIITKFTCKKVSTYQHLYVTKFICNEFYMLCFLYVTKFICNKIYMSQSLHVTNFIHYCSRHDSLGPAGLPRGQEEA